MSELTWSSPLSPAKPSIPRARHWTIGAAVALGAGAAFSAWYASLDHSVDLGTMFEEEEVIVALGGSAPQRIEEPPPPPPDAPVVDSPPPLAERAADAPPIAPPPVPRPVIQWTQGDGNYSSGTGGTATIPVPPVIPPEPPKPAQSAGVGDFFTKISTKKYLELISYPPASEMRHEQGVGQLRVTIRPSGEVLGWKIVQSTGHKRLDREIERVAHMVKALDPLPEGFPAERAVVLITINFQLQ